MRGRSVSALPSIDAIRPITNEYAIPAIGPPRSSILDRAYSKRLAHELELVAAKPRIEPERKLLKRDLLRIYQMKKKKKKRYSSKKIAPWDELKPITSLTSIHAKYHDLESYSKDYILLAREYQWMEKYRIHPREIETAHQLSCVTCLRRGGLDKVFFPCQHRCVCSNCQDKMKPKQCPLCHDPIMIILDNTENVYEEYWTWVDEVQPSISTAFLKSFFVQSKDAIRSAMVDHSDNLSPRVRDISLTCHEGDGIESDHLMKDSNSILSCLKILLCRRAPRVHHGLRD
ncbi:hypothetical protein ACHAW5_003696 [Stephanodiscus triporus]|uniref:RING-type domain-containing protein n=1 Tax=Stephanodiscus triporus TaxID=2934178 RepID=A0ABD3QHZ3_9STRA